MASSIFEALENGNDFNNLRCLGFMLNLEYKSKVDKQMCADMIRVNQLDDLVVMPKKYLKGIYSDAINAAVKGRKDEDKYTVVKVLDNSMKMSHVVVRRDVLDRGVLDADGSPLKDPSFYAEARIEFMRENHKAGKVSAECIRFPENPDHMISRKVAYIYNERANYYDNTEVRTGVEDAFRMLSGVHVVRGNAWFVPVNQAVKVNAISVFLRSIDCVCNVTPVFNFSESIQGVKVAAKDDLLSQLDLLKTKIQSFKDIGSVRSSTLQKQVDELNNLRETVKIYCSILDTEMTCLSGSIDDAENELLTRLTHMTESASV
jgi:hypothetical protein